MDVVNREQFDEAAEQLYRSASAAEASTEALAVQVAYAALLRRKLFGPREKEIQN